MKTNATSKDQDTYYSRKLLDVRIDQMSLIWSRQMDQVPRSCQNVWNRKCNYNLGGKEIAEGMNTPLGDFQYVSLLTSVLTR